MAFRMIQIKDSPLPMGKVWFLDSLGIYIYKYISPNKYHKYFMYQAMPKHCTSGFSTFDVKVSKDSFIKMSRLQNPLLQGVGNPQIYTPFQDIYIYI